MNGNSNLLTLAALGVLGLGSAMPYWSAWTTQPVPEVEPTAASQAQTTQSASPVHHDYWEQQVSRPDGVTLVSQDGPEGGLDNPAHLPSLSMEMEQRAQQVAEPIASAVPFQPSGGVSLASRVEALGHDQHGLTEVAPIALPGQHALPPTPRTPEVTTHRVRKPRLESVPVNAPANIESPAMPLPPIAPPHHGAAAEATHQIRDGDSLEKLAEKYLGSRSMAESIFHANRDVLDSPDLLPIGTTLKIPTQSVQTSQAGSQASPNRWKPVTQLQPLPPPQQSVGGNHPWTNLVDPDRY